MSYNYPPQGLGKKHPRESSYIIEKIDDWHYADPDPTTSLPSKKGTDAATVVNAAINALTTGDIYCKDATYIIGTMIDITKPITFRGAGSGTIFKNKDATDLTCVIRTNSDNCVLENLAIDGNKATINVDANYKNQGITINEDGSNVAVRNCWIHDTYIAGIDGGGNENLIVENNRIWDTGQAGAAFSGHGIYLSFTEHSSIKGNIIKPTTGQSIKVSGIYETAYHGHIAQNNLVANNHCYGERILFYGVKSLGILGNSIVNSPYPIHQAYSTANDLATDILMSGNVIQGDGSTSNEYVLLEHVEDTSFVNNKMRDCASGVSLNAGDRILLEGNSFRNCDVNNAVIYTEAFDVYIKDNLIKDINGAGTGKAINMWAGSGSVVGNYIIQDAVLGEYGIYIHINDLLVEKNKVMNVWGGIYEAGGVDNNKIYRNQLLGCTAPITVVGAGTKVRDNIGYVTENSGFVTIAAQSGSFPHGLVATPTKVLLTPSGSAGSMYLGALGWYPSGSAGVWIVQTGSGTVPVNWMAEV